METNTLPPPKNHNVDLYTEKRQYRRVHWKGTLHVTPVLYSASSDSWEIPDKGYRARGLDISEGGIRLALPPSFPNAEYIRVRFSFKENHPDLILILKRIWMRDYTGGFSYLLLDELDQRLIRGYVDSKELPETHSSWTEHR